MFVVNLCSDPDDRLKIYKENFERAYLDSEIAYYNQHAQQYISDNGIICYLTYADAKIKEEEKRALKYLETCKGRESLELVGDTLYYYTHVSSCQALLENIALCRAKNIAHANLH